MSGVIVNYNNNALTSMSSSGTKTLLTSGKYCEGNFEVVYSEPTTSSLTVTPTETAQTFNATGVYGYKPVTINGISSTYVGSGIPLRSSADVYLSDTKIRGPKGYYSVAFSSQISTSYHQNPTFDLDFNTGVITAFHTAPLANYLLVGAETTSSTYQLNSLGAQTLYPSTADQTIASHRWLTGAQTIKSVTTSNLTASNIAEGVTVKVGDANNASRITQITGTHAGSATPSEQYYKATLINGGNTAFRQYIGYNNKTYYQSGSTFYYKAGDTISYYGESITGSYVYSDGTRIYSSTAMVWGYNYTAPAHPLNIMFSSGVCFNSPTISIGANGIYDVTDYASASVNMLPGHDAVLLNAGTYNTTTPMYKYVSYNGTRYYTNEDTFNFNEGDTIETLIYGIDGYSNVYLNNTLIGSGMTVSFSAPSYPLTVYFSNRDGIHFNKAYPSGTLSITSNGTYSVYGYSSASVNVSGGEYYSVYKHLTFKSAFTSTTDSNIYQSFFNNISSITRYMFAQIFMSGSFSFSNCTYIDSHAFEHTEYNTCGVCNFDFPEVLSINSYAFNFQSFLKTISAPKCSYIGSAAFERCYSLSTAAFPNCSYIGYWAFNSCSNLTTVSFPNCSTIGVSAFYNCYSLTSANFPNCTLLYSQAFYSCSNLTTVSFPALSYIYSGVFGRCSKLEIVNIPNCKIISEYAFYNCSGLISVDFPSCSWISYSAFTNCTGLTSVNFPNCSAIGSYAFSSCTHLISISFPNCSYVGSSAFLACYSLRTADFSTCSTIYGSAFYSCYSLSTAKFPNCTSFGANAFRYCFNLISFYLNNVSSVPTFGANMFLSTPISNYSTSAGRYGSIFVPSSLYTEFTTALSWSVYSARMVSV